MYALTYGQEGVEHWIDSKLCPTSEIVERLTDVQLDLASELQVAMKLVGITDLSQARRGLVNTQDIDYLVVRALDEIYERPRAKI